MAPFSAPDSRVKLAVLPDECSFCRTLKATAHNSTPSKSPMGALEPSFQKSQGQVHSSRTKSFLFQLSPPPKTGGVQGSIRQGVSGALRAPGSGVSQILKCPESVPRHLFDTLGTLSGHFLDTPEPGARSALQTPRRTFPRTPPFISGCMAFLGRVGRVVECLKPFTAGIRYHPQPRIFPRRWGGGALAWIHV